MRLAKTVKSLSGARQNNALVWVLVLLFFTFTEAASQDFKKTFVPGTPLSEALLQSSRIYNFKLAFDARRLGEKYAPAEASGTTLDEFVTDLLRDSGFTFVYRHGSYLIIEILPDGNTEKIRECTLRGSVTDQFSGEQLPYATISLPDQNILVPASTSGTFSIRNVISNPVHVIVSYLGYYQADTTITWTDPEVEVIIRLRQRLNRIDPVEVTGSKLEMVDYRGDVDFATIINPSRITDLPVLTETDIFKTLQLLPGISYSENSAELSIRGGTGDQNLVLFDGQTLYNLSHYYGVFSSINPNIVKDIQVFKGGFDSRYGERISGIIDITGKSGNQLKPSFSADLNLLSINLAAEIPLTRKISFIAAGRRSYSDIYKTSFANDLFSRNIPILKKNEVDTVIISEPKYYFYDLNGKLNYRISNNENLSLSLYGGKDFFRNTYTYRNNSIFVSSADYNTWQNYGLSGAWQKQWNNSLFSGILLSYSGYNNESSNSTVIQKIRSDGTIKPYLPDENNTFRANTVNELKDWSFSAKNTYSINSFNHLNFGLLLRKTGIYYHRDADSIYVYDNTNQSTWISSLFIQDRFNVKKNLVLKPGIRLTYYNSTGKIYPEPRFAARYNMTEKFSVRMATGIYNQFISQVASLQETGYNKAFWVMSNDSLNPVLQALHLIVGVAWEDRKLLLDAELYYKKYEGIQEYIFVSQFLRNSDFGQYFIKRNQIPQRNPDKKPSYFISGSGKSYGIDFFARYKTRISTSWLSYSLSKNTQRFEPVNSGDEIPALTDQRHQLSFSNLFTLGRWNFGLISLFSTGRPYIIESKRVPGERIIRTYGRMPDYFRIDVSANYNFSFRSARIKTGISVINLTNRKNYLDVSTRKFDFDSISFTEMNLIPSQKLSLNLFLHISL